MTAQTHTQDEKQFYPTPTGLFFGQNFFADCWVHILKLAVFVLVLVWGSSRKNPYTFSDIYFILMFSYLKKILTLFKNYYWFGSYYSYNIRKSYAKRDFIQIKIWLRGQLVSLQGVWLHFLIWYCFYTVCPCRLVHLFTARYYKSIRMRRLYKHECAYEGQNLYTLVFISLLKTK